MRQVLERLDLVFGDLAKAGILSVKDMCCGSCSAHWLAEKTRKTPGAVGGVYYSEQDRESCEEGPFDGIYIGFGALDEADTPEIGRRLVDALNRHGFATLWDGSPTSRVLCR